MGLFDRKNKKENAIQINDVKQQFVGCGFDFFGYARKGFKPFAETFLQMCLNQIYNGISNVTFETTKQSLTAGSICWFVDNNATLMVNMWLTRGFICIMYDKKGNYRFPEQNELKFDQWGRVVNRDCVVIYSNEYQIKRKTPMMIVKPLLDLIDNLGNTVSESTTTMGVLPVISGNSIPANPAFKKDLEEMMSHEYGLQPEKLRYFLSQQELKIDSIDLHIKDLELRDNLESAFKYLLDYFQVPVDLVLGNSTYTNVETARLYFYESTIRKYAEIILKVARALLTANPELIPQNIITYRITNVSGVDKSLSDKCSERNSYIDLLVKLRDNGVDTDEELARVYSDIKKDYLEA